MESSSAVQFSIVNGEYHYRDPVPSTMGSAISRVHELFSAVGLGNIGVFDPVEGYPDYLWAHAHVTTGDADLDAVVHPASLRDDEVRAVLEAGRPTDEVESTGTPETAIVPEDAPSMLAEGGVVEGGTSPHLISVPPVVAEDPKAILTPPAKGSPGSGRRRRR
jgi:hypothetical protein